MVGTIRYYTYTVKSLLASYTDHTSSHINNQCNYYTLVQYKLTIVCLGGVFPTPTIKSSLCKRKTLTSYINILRYVTTCKAFVIYFLIILCLLVPFRWILLKEININKPEIVFNLFIGIIFLCSIL